MNQELYTYATQMKSYLDAQSKRITLLETELTQLKEAMKQVPAEPSVTIEKIEYKFDQLKIERLDGTLNIGLNPANLHELEEITANGANGYPIPFPKQFREQLTEEISEAITAHVETELSSLIADVEGEMNIHSQGEYENFIKDDLFKQMHDRIQHYLNQFPFNEKNERNSEYKERIIEQIKTDIHQAVRAFYQNIQNNMKGM
ncbi:MAG: spore germination protein GerPC [Bacillus sp. (in: firmicutes)]